MVEGAAHRHRPDDRPGAVHHAVIRAGRRLARRSRRRWRSGSTWVRCSSGRGGSSSGRSCSGWSPPRSGSSITSPQTPSRTSCGSRRDRCSPRVLWILFSLGFKIYVTNFSDYNETYGAIGGVIVLLLWFYTSGLAILIGAEMNAEIEHASPYGKDPGEKVAGEKKKLGLAAWRQWRERKKKGEPVGPPPEPPRPVAPPPNLAPARPRRDGARRHHRRRTGVHPRAAAGQRLALAPGMGLPTLVHRRLQCRSGARRALRPALIAATSTSRTAARARSDPARRATGAAP